MRYAFFPRFLFHSITAPSTVLDRLESLKRAWACMACSPKLRCLSWVWTELLPANFNADLANSSFIKDSFRARIFQNKHEIGNDWVEALAALLLHPVAPETLNASTFLASSLA